MRLVIHMGATKTASTSLQRQLATNEELLAEHGIVIPKTGRRTQKNANHHNIAWGLIGDRRFKESNGDWKALVAELGESDADIALVSSEGFARLAGGDDCREAFAATLSDFPDVELVYVVREPLARINSMYTQSVKTFADTTRFSKYAKRAMHSRFYDLEHSFHDWYEGDQVRFTALRFDEFVTVGPLTSVLRALEVEMPEDRIAAPDGEMNVSPGPIAVEALRLLNTTLRAMDWEFNRRSIPASLVSKQAQRRAKDLGWFEERFWGWDPDKAEDAANRLAESNERFALRAWGTPWPFPAPLDTERTSVSLADLKRGYRRSAFEYVEGLVEKYMKLVRNRELELLEAQNEDEDGSDIDDDDDDD